MMHISIYLLTTFHMRAEFNPDIAPSLFEGASLDIISQRYPQGICLLNTAISRIEENQFVSPGRQPLKSTIYPPAINVISPLRTLDRKDLILSAIPTRKNHVSDISHPLFITLNDLWH